MLDYKAALQRVLACAPTSEAQSKTESIEVYRSLGRVLSKSFAAQVDLPPFTTSSVDGFAVRIPNNSVLELIGEVPAGAHQIMTIGHLSKTVEVFTGSVLPQDTDAVVMLEDVQREGASIRVTRQAQIGDNIRRKGEEILASHQLLGQGVVVTPAVVGLLSSCGQTHCSVYRRPKISIIELGNELRSPGQSLALGEIYAANGAALGAAAESLGAEVTLTRCGDDPEALRTVVSNAIRCSDIVITSGGASVGKHDHVRPAFASLDIEEIFWKVAIRPGCPLYFGRVAPKSNQRKGCLVFGLPGNPVSSLVTFFLFVRPAIYRYYGLHSPPVVRGRTSMPLESSSEVDVFARISLHDGTIFPVQAQGSHMTSGLATATGLCRLPKGAGTIPAGSSLEVQPLQWTL